MLGLLRAHFEKNTVNAVNRVNCNCPAPSTLLAAQGKADEMAGAVGDLCAWADGLNKAVEQEIEKGKVKVQFFSFLICAFLGYVNVDYCNYESNFIFILHFSN